MKALYSPKPRLKIPLRKNNGQFKKKMSKIARRTIIIVSVIILGTLLYKLVNIVQPTKPLVMVQAHNVVIVVAHDRAYTTMYSKAETCPNKQCVVAANKKVTNLTKTGTKIIACPRYFKFGTLVRIDGVIYTCVDRTADRFDGRFDIWAGDSEDSYDKAISYGKKLKDVETVIISD